MVFSSISRVSTRRPNDGWVLKNLESRHSHPPGGFRCPSGQRSQISVPHATTDVRLLPRVLPASTPVLVGSVFLKNETCDPSHWCISANIGLLMPARLKGVKGHPWQGQA